MAKFCHAVVRICATVAIGTMSLGVVPAARAQISSSAIPAEFPPTDYSANQYVDSDGCAFIRAGISGMVSWVPRVDRDRQQLCGFQPTFAAAPPPVPSPVPAPEVQPVIAAAQAPVAPVEVAPAPVVAAAPRAPRAPRVADPGMPIETVAGLVTPPRIRTAPPVEAAVAAQDPAPVVAPVVAPVPTPIRQSEACDGLFGVQPNLINARTGEPIDCGPAPQIAMAQVEEPQAIAPEPLRLTIAEACARSAETGQIFVNRATGRPVDCADAQPVGEAPVVRAEAQPTVTAPVAVADCPGVTAVGGPARYPVRCGPQEISPSGVSSALIAGPHSVARAQAQVFGSAPVPASNPVGATIVVATVPPGYKTVWEDGRINPARGVPAGLSGPVLAGPSVAPVAPAARVSTRSVPQAVAAAPVQASGHRYVQVGTYGDAANAERAVARLSSLGLPVGLARITRNGQALQVVAAGPFADAGGLQAALQAARSAGYGDAFTRR